MSSVVIKSADRGKVEKAITAYVRRLRNKHPEIVRVIWFGSWVTGLPTPGSDVDLCLILSSAADAPRQRTGKYLPTGFSVGIDLFAYTRKEFRRLKESSPGWHRAISSGQDIYVRPERGFEG